MLELKNISVSFADVKIFENINLTVKAGDLTAIIGHNGAGKSTLFNIVSGHIIPTSGQVLFDGVDVTMKSELQRAAHVGRLYQNVAQGSVVEMTLRDNLCLAMLKNKSAGLRLGSKLFPDWVIDQWLRPLKLNLENQLDIKMGMLSGGQRQIIAFIMAIVTNPKILLLDEPTAALDPDATVMLNSVIKQFVKKNNIPALLITHDLAAAHEISDEVYRLQRGSKGLEKINF